MQPIVTCLATKFRIVFIFSLLLLYLSCTESLIARSLQQENFTTITQSSSKQSSAMPTMISDNSSQTSESEASMNMRENDPNGYAMSIMSMTVVFCGLLVLFLSFKYLSKVIALLHSNGIRSKKSAISSSVIGTGKLGIENEVAVAIAMTLEKELHANDPHEPTLLTFSSIDRKYSPWGSKSLLQRRNPRHFDS